MDIERHVQQFDELGYTLLEQIVADDDRLALRAATEDALERDWERCRHLPGKQRFIVLDLVQYDPVFRRFLENAAINAVFDRLLSPHWTLYSFTSTVLHPRDNPYTCDMHTDTIRFIPGYVTSALVTLALDDFTADNGATWFLPGSHRVETRPTDEEFRSGAVQAVRRAGDAVVFHPRVWHAGGLNTTSRSRFGLTVYGCRPWMKQRFDFPRLLESCDLRELGSIGRRILGFEARVPTSLEEFYRLPDDRLYKAQD